MLGNNSQSGINRVNLQIGCNCKNIRIEMLAWLLLYVCFYLPFNPTEIINKTVNTQEAMFTIVIINVINCKTVWSRLKCTLKLF